MMNPVETVLLQNIDNPASLFIFPTDVAASRWADHVLHLRGGGTVAMNRFIAWDTFKQNSVRSKVQRRKSVPSVLRTIFTSRLIQENAALCAQGGIPLFSSLVSPEWAREAASFAGWITSLLPQLGIWFRKTAGMDISLVTGKDAAISAKNFDADDRDLFTLAVRYAQFLADNGLFEPAWETPPFDDTGRRCFIFFPESLSDFSEYRELLAESGHVQMVGTVDNTAIAEAAAQKKPEVFFYTNSRSEITEASLYIRALHENSGLSWDSISVSIPDTESYEPYILREFDNRNIPWVKRSGKPLASCPAGQFFRDLANCVSGDFAFSALARLLLNSHLPWKDGETIKTLIDFGIKNNCISSWVETNKPGEPDATPVNVWEDAFEKPFGGIDPDARRFFKDLKWRITALRKAASFAELRKNYFVFRESFFDMENCLPETDLILSRCISELMYLVEIEKDFPGLKAPDPFLFFAEYLGEVNYLAQQEKSGVVILPYRTAAPAPFGCHVILGAGQESLSMVFSRLGFLPRTKREKLGAADEDASAAFINLHRLNSEKPAAFFCSEQSFLDYTIPHSHLEAEKNPRSRYAQDPTFAGKFSDDLFSAESAALAKGLADGGGFSFLHGIQTDGFTNWLERRNQEEDTETDWFADDTLLELIRDRFCNNADFPGKYSVSASSLAPYYHCSLQWLFERVLSLENVQIEANLMAGNIAGLVYHAILHLFFSELKEPNDILEQPDYSRGPHNPQLPGTYRSLLRQSVDAVFANFPRLPENDHAAMSALSARLLEAEKNHFYLRLERCLAALLSFFAGCRVIGSEVGYQSDRETFFLNGILDCILEDRRKKPEAGEDSKNPLVIIDFKLNSMPHRADCTGEKDEGLVNFQLPLYVSLAEEKEAREVHTALFFSILKTEPEVLFGFIENTRKKSPYYERNRIAHNSERFRQIQNEFEEKAKRFAGEMASGDFSALNHRFDQCVSCKYHRVCRTIYKIDGKNFKLAGNDNGV